MRAALTQIVLAPLAATILLAAPEAAARRDPTQPPAGYGAAPSAPRDPIEAFRPGHLVVVDGQRYLVWAGRRYGVGDTVHGARIERLEETAVWLKSGDRVRKLPLYPGIEKQASTGGRAP